jgi:hypothetical protein
VREIDKQSAKNLRIAYQRERERLIRNRIMNTKVIFNSIYGVFKETDKKNQLNC